MSGPLGWRQGKVLKFIGDFQLKHGHSPSIRQIGDGVGLSSSSSVAWHLSQLELKGLISRDGHTRGTVTVNKLVTVNREDLAQLLVACNGLDWELGTDAALALSRLVDQMEPAV